MVAQKSLGAQGRFIPALQTVDGAEELSASTTGVNRIFSAVSGIESVVITSNMRGTAARWINSDSSFDTSQFIDHAHHFLQLTPKPTSLHFKYEKTEGYLTALSPDFTLIICGTSRWNYGLLTREVEKSRAELLQLLQDDGWLPPPARPAKPDDHPPTETFEREAPDLSLPQRSSSHQSFANFRAGALRARHQPHAENSPETRDQNGSTETRFAHSAPSLELLQSVVKGIQKI